MSTLTIPEPATTDRSSVCTHQPPCPPASASDHDAAKVVFHDHQVGFSLLCNGVEVFADTGEILPDRTVIAPHRPEPLHRAAA